MNVKAAAAGLVLCVMAAIPAFLAVLYLLEKLSQVMP